MLYSQLQREVDEVEESIVVCKEEEASENDTLHEVCIFI